MVISMGRIRHSGLGNGTIGFPQESLFQFNLKIVSDNITNNIEEHESYLSYELPSTSPLKIPKNAIIIEQEKNGYSQVKYSWHKGKYDYICRWHTKTPNSPAGESSSWVVERTIPGIGHGKNARPRKTEVLIHISTSGKHKWIDKKIWQEAIRARKNGTLTEKQKEILQNGHWKAD